MGDAASLFFSQVLLYTHLPSAELGKTSSTEIVIVLFYSQPHTSSGIVTSVHGSCMCHVRVIVIIPDLINTNMNSSCTRNALVIVMPNIGNCVFYEWKTALHLRDSTNVVA